MCNKSSAQSTITKVSTSEVVSEGGKKLICCISGVYNFLAMRVINLVKNLKNTFFLQQQLTVH